MVTVDQQLDPFLSKCLGLTDYKLYQLAGDASNRRYYRVIANDRSWVLMRWEPFDPENYPFISVLNHFAKNNVHVPKIEGISASEGLMLLEDLGDLTLERKFWETQDHSTSYEFYELAIDELIKIHYPATDHKAKCTAFDLQFDTEKLLWEMNYGREHLLNGVLKFSMPGPQSEALQKLFTDICQRLHAEPKRIAHRDYHSRNLMIKLDKVVVIDFQDARLGSVQYDLVSLLKDSYVDMPDHFSDRLKKSYLEKSKPYLDPHFSTEHFELIYQLQSIQRCFKACGSFASFFSTREDRRYLKYLSGTLRRVLKSLALFPEYKLFTDILIDSGALEKKYEQL